MGMKVIYVDLDVDHTQYHGSALNKNTGEVITYQCRPTLASLLKQIAMTVVGVKQPVEHSEITGFKRKLCHC